MSCSAAHEAGIVHRDLKPGNLMVLYPNTPQETIKLMDFGLAKMTSMLYISMDELVDYTLPPAAGTPEYISPEQVRGSEIDGRGDLYSVGVMLYEMLSGQRPFDGSVDYLLTAHSDERPPTFAERGLPDLVPPAVEEVVRSCLQKNPDQRPEDGGGSDPGLRTGRRQAFHRGPPGTNADAAESAEPRGFRAAALSC